ASGKPFLAHLVGTASVLVSWRAPVDVAVGGLLHAAYMAGDFGPSTFAAKRHRMIARVGYDVEQYVYSYTLLGTSPEEWRSLADEGGSMGRIVRRLSPMRRVNELEEMLVLVPFYCGPSRSRRQLDMGRRSVAVARNFGSEKIATEFERKLEQIETTALPP